MKLTPIEQRVLAYLDQRGPTHRARVVQDLASPGTRHANGRARGSNGAAPMIMANWCRRLVKAGFVQQRSSPSRFHNRRGEHYKTLHFYDHHEITQAGRQFLRSAPVDGADDAAKSPIR